MGFFGGQTKDEGRLDFQTIVEEPDEEQEDLPVLPKPRSNTVIAKGVTLTGALHGEGVIQVEGTVEGEIELQGSVIVATTGLIRGPITADVIRIAGCVEGNINARDHLRLEKTGDVVGDVTTVSLVVEDGGRLNGRSTMNKPKQEPIHPTNDLPLDDLQFGANYKPEEDVEDTVD